MVLNDLGRSINHALQGLFQKPVIDEKVLDEVLKEICAALLSADVNVRQVQALRMAVKKTVALENLGGGVNKQRVIQKAVLDELGRLLDPGVAPFKPRKGGSTIFMLVGLQGSGKTTTCTKLAHYYQRKGWKVGIICADTFRAGAFDQLKQNATKAKIPFFGSYSESDPVKITAEGIAKFQRENFELIVVDTSGRHKQESALFEEMRLIAAAAKPDLNIFVMDAAIGQAADAQARAFKAAVDVGGIILTKMDGHARGGGAISGIAATQSPIMFVGVGEHIEDLELFDARSFVSRMLGMGDIRGLTETVKDLALDKQSAETLKNLEQGVFRIRDFYEQLQMILKMGPLGKIMGMLPGIPPDLLQGNEADASARLRRWMVIMDSMTGSELDSEGKPFATQPRRILRVARGAGVFPPYVEELLTMHRKFGQMIKTMGGNKGLMRAFSGDPSASSRVNPQQMAGLNRAMSSMMPPELLKQMGGIGGLQNMMRQMGQGGGMPDMNGDEKPRGKTRRR